MSGCPSDPPLPNGIPLTFAPHLTQEARTMTTTASFGLTGLAALRGTGACSFGKKYYFTTSAGHD